MQLRLDDLLRKGKRKARSQEQQCVGATQPARNSQSEKRNLFSVLREASNTAPAAKNMSANPFARGAASTPRRQFGRGGSPAAPERPQPSHFSTKIPNHDPEQHERQSGARGFKQAVPIDTSFGRENQHGGGRGAARTARAQPGVAAAHYPPPAAELQQAYLDIDPAVEAQVAARRAAKAEDRRRQQQEAELRQQEKAAEMKKWRAAEVEQQRRRQEVAGARERQRREQAKAQKPPTQTTRSSTEDAAWLRNEGQQWAYGGDYEAWRQSEQERRSAFESGYDSYARPSSRCRGFNDADPDDHWGAEEGSPRQRDGQDHSGEEGEERSAEDGWGHGTNGGPSSFSQDKDWYAGAAEGQSGGSSSGASDEGDEHADDEAYSQFRGEEWEEWKHTWQQHSRRHHSGAGGDGGSAGAYGSYYEYYGQQQRTYQRQQQQQRGPMSGEDAARAAAKAVYAAQQKAAAVPEEQRIEAAVELKVANAVRSANGNIAAFATALGVRYGPAVGSEGSKAARKALLLRYHPDKLHAASQAEQLMGQHVTRALNTMPK